MLFFLSVCLLGHSVVLGYSTLDRGSNLLNKRENVLTPKDALSPPNPDVDGNVITHYGNIDNTVKVDGLDEDDNQVDILEKDNEVCQDYNDIVLNHLVGFPDLSEMSNNVDPHYTLPIIVKGVATFELTNDAKMAAKKMVVSLTDELLNMKKHCPSTIFTRILIYAAGKSFNNVLQQEKAAYNDMVRLMVEHKHLQPENVRQHTKQMLGILINDFTQDIISRQFNESHAYIKTIYPTIVRSLKLGEKAKTIELSLMVASREAGMTLHCMNVTDLMDIYGTVLNDLDTRFKDNFDVVLNVLHLLTNLPVTLKEHVRNECKVLLRRGVQNMRSILSGLRDERLGQLQNDTQRLLNSTELEALKKVVAELRWRDEPVKLPVHDVVNIVIEKERKDIEKLNRLFKMVNAISTNLTTYGKEDLSSSLKLLSAKLNDLMRQKCDTYEKYLGPYGSPISECKLLRN